MPQAPPWTGPMELYPTSGCPSQTAPSFEVGSMLLESTAFCLRPDTPSLISLQPAPAHSLSTAVSASPEIHPTKK
jgi:hypothetical protein